MAKTCRSASLNPLRFARESATAFPEVGKTMLFLFDYGDEWRFKVELIGLGRKEPGAV